MVSKKEWEYWKGKPILRTFQPTPTEASIYGGVNT